MVNICVFASGNGSNFENIVKSKIKNGIVKLLIVDHGDAYAIKRAIKLNIPYIFINPKAYKNKEEYEIEIKKHLDEYKIDLIALAGYMRYIGKVLLEAYPNKIINLHPAYLPNFPGATSIRDAYEAKVPYTGVTIHYVDAGVDTGEVIHQEKIIIDPKWDLDELEKHVHALEYKMYPEVLNKLCNLN